MILQCCGSSNFTCQFIYFFNSKCVIHKYLYLNKFGLYATVSFLLMGKSVTTELALEPSALGLRKIILHYIFLGRLAVKGDSHDTELFCFVQEKLLT